MSSHPTIPELTGYVARQPARSVVDNTMWECVMSGEFEPGQLLDINGRPARVISSTPLGQATPEGAALLRIVYHPLNEVELFEMEIRAANEAARDGLPAGEDPFAGILEGVRRPGLQGRPPLRPIGRPAPDVVPPALALNDLGALNRAYEQSQVTPQEYLVQILGRGDGEMLQQADEAVLRQAHSIARQITRRPECRDDPRYHAFEQVLQAELAMIDEMRRAGIEVTVDSRTEQYRIRGVEQMMQMAQAGLISTASIGRRVMGVDWAQTAPPVASASGTATTSNGIPDLRELTRDDFMNMIRDLQTRIRDTGVDEVFVHPRTAANMRRLARDELGGQGEFAPDDRFTMFGMRIRVNRHVEPGVMMARQEMPGDGPERVRGVRGNAVVLDEQQQMDPAVMASLLGMPDGTRVNVQVTDDVEAADGPVVLDDGTFGPDQDYGPGQAYTGDTADQQYVVEAARPFASNVAWAEGRIQLEGIYRALRLALPMFAEEAGLRIEQSAPTTAAQVSYAITLEGETIGHLTLQAGSGVRARPPQESRRRQTPEEGQRALEI